METPGWILGTGGGPGCLLADAAKQEQQVRATGAEPAEGMITAAKDRQLGTEWANEARASRGLRPYGRLFLATPSSHVGPWLGRVVHPAFCLALIVPCVLCLEFCDEHLQVYEDQ